MNPGLYILFMQNAVFQRNWCLYGALCEKGSTLPESGLDEVSAY